MPPPLPEIRVDTASPIPSITIHPTAPDAAETSGYSPVQDPFGGIDPFADDSGLRLRGRRTPPAMSPSLSPGTVGWYGRDEISESTDETVREAAEVRPVTVVGVLDDSEWREQIRSFMEAEMGAGGSRSGGGSPRSPRSPRSGGGSPWGGASPR